MRKLTDCVGECITAYYKTFGTKVDISFRLEQDGDIADVIFEQVTFNLCICENGWNVTDYHINEINRNNFSDLVNSHEQSYKLFCSDNRLD